MNIQNANFVPVNEGGNLTFIRPSQLAEAGTTGVILQGIYVGSQANQLNPEKLDYAFETADGGKTIVNGTASLAGQMSKVSEGDLVQIEYLGKTKTKNGKQAHRFVVSTARNSEE